MSTLLPPLEHENKAWDTLREFAAGDRTRGEDYFRKGRVLGLSCVAPGTHYQADVEGRMVYEVNWELVAGEW